MANPKLGLFHMHESNPRSLFQLDAKLFALWTPHVAEDHRTPLRLVSRCPYTPPTTLDHLKHLRRPDTSLWIWDYDLGYDLEAVMREIRVWMDHG